MWIKVYRLEWEWVREFVLDIRDTKMLIFFPENGQNHIFYFIYLFSFFCQKMAKKKKKKTFFVQKIFGKA